jgi:hypothetical protein
MATMRNISFSNRDHSSVAGCFQIFSRRNLEPFRFLDFAAEQEAVFLVGA